MMNLTAKYLWKTVTLMQLRRDGQMIQVVPFLSQLKTFLADRSDVAAAYIFGSYGTQYQTPLSDLDIALLLRRKSAPVTLEERLGLEMEISRILQEDDVNLLILNQAPLALRYKVLSEGRIVYRDAKGADLEDFIENTLKYYLDFRIDLCAFTKEYDQSRLPSATCAKCGR